MKRITQALWGVVLGLLAASAAFAQTATVPSLTSITNRGATYYASANFTLMAAPTDIAILKGSATKTVFVRQVEVSCIQNTASTIPVAIIKRTVANTDTAASVVNPTITKADSGDGAATAVMTTYVSTGGANPTLGTGTTVDTQKLTMLSSVAPTSAPNVFKKVWGADYMAKYIVLRGTAQGLAINFGGATVTGATCAVNYAWIER